MDYNISVSLIKAFDKFTVDEYCGRLFKELYIFKSVSVEPSEAMRKGQWFEYMATGAKLRDGSIPESEKTAKGFLTAPYQKLAIQAENFLKFSEYYGVEDFKTGVVAEYEGNKGIFDIETILDDKPLIIDLKTSGYLMNRWEEYGWHPDTIVAKDVHILQAKMYCYLYFKLHGIIPRFQFWVFSSANDWESMIFEIECNENTVEEIERRCKFTREMIDYHLTTNSFDEKPDYVRCMGCPIMACKQRRLTPNYFLVKV